MAASAETPSDTVDALKQEGSAHLKAGRHDSAAQSYTRALDSGPTAAESAVLLANRALANLKLGKHSACVADCDAALQLESRYAKAMYRRAQAHEALGELSEAFRDVRELLNIEPSNGDAQKLAARLHKAIKMRAATGDLSTPMLAVEQLLRAADPEDQLQAAGKLGRIAEDSSRAQELMRAGAIRPLLSLLPAPELALDAAAIEMPLVGVALQALERISHAEQNEVLRAIAEGGESGGKSGGKSGDSVGGGASVIALLRAAADAPTSLARAGSSTSEELLKNWHVTTKRCLSLLANLAVSESATPGRSKPSASLVFTIISYLRHSDEKVSRAAMDAMLRLANASTAACEPLRARLLLELIWLLGDEEGATHRSALALLGRVFAPEGDEKDGTDNTKALCDVCAAALSPLLRDAAGAWEAHVAAVHGVTAVLAVNKAVGAWLLRQESIFWSLAEVVDMEDDEELQRSLAEIYAHAANDAQHFREKEGDEPIRQLKKMIRSNKPPVRARACVALAKVALLHHTHRVTINPTGRLLEATLGLLEAKVSPSVHRWAVEALMFLSVMPDMKAHLAASGARFGSLISLAESVGKDSSFHFALVSALRRLCVPREKSDEQQKLEQEMDKEQIEQMRQLAAGGAGVAAAPQEREDDPEVLKTLAAQLVDDDAVMALSEVVAHAAAAEAAEGSVALRRQAAQVLLAMAAHAEGRGKLVAQGGFRALISLVLSDDDETWGAAAWALARVGISINPLLYPRKIGSGPESMVKPLLKLIDQATNELQMFEASMALCNLATDADLGARIVSAGGWRTLQMALTSDNELVQRAALEAMSNLVTQEPIIERFAASGSNDVKIFVGFSGCDDLKSKIATTGALATLADIPEVGAAIIGANGVEPLIDAALLGEDSGLIHRAAVALQKLLTYSTDLMVGAKGSAPPDHALSALGALVALSRGSVEPAKKAAITAIVHLQKKRPDVALPPPDAVAIIVAKIKEDEERRRQEAMAAQLAAEDATETHEEEAGEEGRDDGDAIVEIYPESDKENKKSGVVV